MNDSHDGRLIVVSGPSGVGKTSIVDRILESTDAVFAISATTRAPRSGETNGIEYVFLNRAEFVKRIGTNEMLEWAEYGGNFYGTPRSEVEPLLSRGVDVILDIENEGAKQVRLTFPDAILLFIRPPSLDELDRRLRSRGDTTPSDIARRLAVAEDQIAEAAGVYDHIVVNGDLDTAIERVRHILR